MSPLNRVWLSTAMHEYHACPAEYPGVNETPTLRATNMNSCYRACCWPLELYMLRCYAYLKYVCICNHNQVSLLMLKGNPWVCIRLEQYIAIARGWVDGYRVTGALGKSAAHVLCWWYLYVTIFLTQSMQDKYAMQHLAFVTERVLIIVEEY